MDSLEKRLGRIDWATTVECLNDKGFAVINDVLKHEECKGLIEGYENDNLYRKTVVMERYRFGLGEYKYFKYPLPDIITILRGIVYPYLSPMANLWMAALQTNNAYPATHDELKAQCHSAGQRQPTVLILKYKEGGYNTLHQDLYGEIYFPIQLVVFLNEPDEDYSGGEFVLTETFPRAQSKATVLKLKRGDMLLFTTNFRPAKGIRGHYRVITKHGVSPVKEGTRHTLGIIFHDALT